MTDFHDELGRRLHAAARRQRRWGPLMLVPRGVVGAVAATAAILVVAVVALAAVGREAERDVGAPAPQVTGGPATCGADRPPAAVLDAIEVLRRPAEAGDEMPQAVRRRLDAGEFEHPARLFVDAARRARPSAWIVPVLIGEPCEGAAGDAPREPGACLLLEHPDAQAPRCGTLEELRRGIGITDLDRADGTWLGFAIVPDGHLASLEHSGATTVVGDVAGNVWRVAYDGDAQTARFHMREDDPGPRSAPASDGECPGGAAAGSAPEAIVDRFALLRRPPDPPTDFRLDEPSVARVYGQDARIARYGSGLEVLVVPVMMGGCEPPDGMAGLCLVPFDADPSAECQVVEGGDARWPVVVALRLADGHGATEVAGIVSDSTAGAVVAWPGGRLEVESEGGRIAATVPHDAPGEVRVTPVARP